MTSRTEPAIARAGMARNTLAGRVAIVTGAGRGIGREAARACAWLGAQVIVADLSAAGRETTDLIAAEGGAAHFVRADIADEGFAAALAAAAAATYAPADVLINSAMLCEVAPAAETTAALWDRTLAVNLRGPFLACRAALPAMLRRGRGVIVNLVSADALPGLAAYSASQHGLIAFTRSLAAEVGGRGVRVVAMTPGVVDTPGLRALAGELAPRLGLSGDALLGSSPHPAYAGPMPAEDAGAAVACLAADPGAGAGGQLVSGYAVLERAGLIAPAPQRHSHAAGRMRGEEVAAHGSDLGAQIQAALSGHGPAPVAREVGGRGARTLHTWHETLDDLERQIERAEAEAQGLDAALHARWVMLRESLFSLQAYYARVPEETARLSSDPEFLRRVEHAAARRLRLIDDLLVALERS